MGLPAFVWIFLLLTGVPVIILAPLLFLSKGKTYVLQPDGHSAKLGIYPICLVDNGVHRIWVKKVDGDVLVETVHEYIPVEKREQIWANNHILNFNYKEGDIIVSWGKELNVMH